MKREIECLNLSVITKTPSLPAIHITHDPLLIQIAEFVTVYYYLAIYAFRNEIQRLWILDRCS